MQQFEDSTNNSPFVWQILEFLVVLQWWIISNMQQNKIFSEYFDWLNAWCQQFEFEIQRNWEI